jgi:hypothetical protein
MTNRVTYAPQDFEKMCRQADRDHESRKLIVLLERVKKQIAARENFGLDVDSPKPPAGTNDSSLRLIPSRTVLFER